MIRNKNTRRLFLKRFLRNKKYEGGGKQRKIRRITRLLSYQNNTEQYKKRKPGTKEKFKFNSDRNYTNIHNKQLRSNNKKMLCSYKIYLYLYNTHQFRYNKQLCNYE